MTSKLTRRSHKYVGFYRPLAGFVETDFAGNGDEGNTGCAALPTGRVGDMFHGRTILDRCQIDASRFFLYFRLCSSRVAEKRNEKESE
jgi:hypothetical protein